VALPETAPFGGYRHQAQVERGWPAHLFEHDEDTPAFSRPSGKASGVAGTYPFSGGDENDVDCVEESRKDCGQITAGWSIDDREPGEVSSHLCHSGQSEIAHTGHGAPASGRGNSCKECSGEAGPRLATTRPRCNCDSRATPETAFREELDQGRQYRQHPRLSQCYRPGAPRQFRQGGATHTSCTTCSLDSLHRHEPSHGVQLYEHMFGTPSSRRGGSGVMLTR
jgi:hypothetical protein